MKSRYYSHGSYGTLGINRVNLIRSRATGIFFVDYRDKKTGKRHRLNLKTTDLKMAQNKILKITDELAEQGYSQQGTSGPPSILYVVQRGDDGPIKVGITRSIKKRLADLQNGNAERLYMLRVFTMSDVERIIHAELERVSRLEGEWFPADSLPAIDRFFTVPETVIEERKRRLNARRNKQLMLR